MRTKSARFLSCSLAMELITLSKETCNDLVKEKLGTVDKCKIIDLKFEPIGDGRSGLLGDHSILKVKTEASDEELRFFIKTPPSNPSQREFSDNTNVFYKEDKFYNKIIPEIFSLGIKEIKDVAPISYSSPRADVLVFEDLSTKGYKVLDSREPLPLEAVRLALVTFAKFHASCLIFEELMTQQTKKIYRIIDHYPNELKESFYCNVKGSIGLINATARCIPTQIDLFPELTIRNLSDFKNYATKIWTSVAQYSKPSEKFRNVICQGDPWITNLLYKIDNQNQLVDCKLVDYQMNRYSPPAQDVISLIYLSTDRKFRSKHLKDCLKFYYDTLISILKKYDIPQDIFSEEEFWESCDYYEPFAVAQSLSHSHVTKLSPLAIKDIFDDSETCQAFLMVDKTEHFIKFCNQDAAYKEKQKESVLDFMELYEKTNV